MANSAKIQPQVQFNFSSSKQRDEFMFENKFMSDCAFIVEEEEIKTKIPCHKYILGTECILYEHCFLTDKQTVDILKCIGSSGEHDCGFSSIERYGILKTITVSGDIVSSHKSIWYPTEFSSNNPINLVGMGIYGRKTNITSKSVKFIIKLKCDERINFVSKNEFEINFDGTDKIYQVIFKVPIPLEANLLYTAKMKDNSADDLL